MAGIRFPVIPDISDRSLSQFTKQLELFAKKAKIDMGKIIKYKPEQEIKELKDLIRDAGLLRKKLDGNLGNLIKEYTGYVQTIYDAQKKLSDTKAQLEALDDKDSPEGEQLKEELKRQTESLVNARKQLDEFSRSKLKEKKQINELITLRRKEIKQIVSKNQAFASFNPKEAAGGVLEGLKSALSGGDILGGLKSTLFSAAKGAAGARARTLEARKETGDPGQQMAALASMRTLSGLSTGAMGAVAGVGAIIAVAAKASEAMTKMNKELTKGIGLARDQAGGTEKYTKTLNEITDAVIKNNISWIGLGISEQDALETINAYTEAASGSIIATGTAFREMTDAYTTAAGVKKFVEQAKLYGNALGMEAKEVGSIIGGLTSELGMNQRMAISVMDDVVRQAAQANMPLSKFTEIFRTSIPNLDMFTNRIENVTGMMKLMSKTMDPRKLKQFMDTMSRGFDARSFRDRLKMALVVGPEQTTKIMMKDIDDQAKNIMKAMPQHLQENFSNAFKAGTLKEFAAKATLSADVPPALIDSVKRLERMQKGAKSGDVTNLATAMKDMGTFGRLEMLEKYATRFGPNKDLMGISEHVADMLGVTKDEAEMLISLRQATESHMINLATIGYTGSKSVNDGLMELYRSQNHQITNFQDFQALMKIEATKNPKLLEENIKRAAAMQIDNDKRIADEASKKEASLNEMTHDLVKATMSSSDILENYIYAVLKKIYSFLKPALDSISNALAWLTGTDTEKEGIKEISNYLHKWTTATAKDGSKLTDDQAKAFQDMTRNFSADMKLGSSGFYEANKELIGTTSEQIIDTLKSSGYTEDQLVKMGFIDKKAVKSETVESAGLSAPRSVATEYAYTAKSYEEVVKALGNLETKTIARAAADKSWYQARAMTGPYDTETLKNKKYDKSFEGASKAARERTEDTGDFETRGGTASPFAAPRTAAGPDTLASLEARYDAIQSGTIEATEPEIEQLRAAIDQRLASGETAPTPGASTTESTKSIEKTSTQTAEASESMDSVLTKMWKHIYANKLQVSMESTFFEKYKTDMQEVIKKGVEKPLFDQTLLYAKMWEDDDFRKALADNAFALSDSDFTARTLMDSLNKQPGETASKPFTERIPAALAEEVPKLASGGYVLQSGLAHIHAGEYVGTPEKLGMGGGGSKVVNIGNITINTETDASAESIAAAVYDMANRV